jgi:hypothetical protein
MLLSSGTAVAGPAADPGATSSAAVLAAPCQHLLAVVWASGPPEASGNTQQLSYAVSDIAAAVPRAGSALWGEPRTSSTFVMWL